jgi:hypothetical protein
MEKGLGAWLQWYSACLASIEDLRSNPSTAKKKIKKLKNGEQEYWNER